MQLRHCYIRIDLQKQGGSMTPVSPSIRFCFLVSTCLIRAGNFAREHIDAANFQRRWFRLTSAPKGLQFLSRDLRQFVGRVVRICVSLRVFYCLPEKEKFSFPENNPNRRIYSLPFPDIFKLVEGFINVLTPCLTQA